MFTCSFAQIVLWRVLDIFASTKIVQPTSSCGQENGRLVPQCLWDNCHCDLHGRCQHVTHLGRIAALNKNRDGMSV